MSYDNLSSVSQFFLFPIDNLNAQVLKVDIPTYTGWRYIGRHIKSDYNLVWDSLRLINCEVVYEKRKLTQTRLCKYNLFNNFKYSL
jgi:hypothetical protein